MAGRIFRLDWDSESVFTAGMDGVGTIGDLIGGVDTRCITAADTILGAIRFTTGAISTEEGLAGEQTAAAADLMASVVEIVRAQTRETDLPTPGAAQ
jgi:hypothetical protein